MLIQILINNNAICPEFAVSAQIRLCGNPYWRSTQSSIERKKNKKAALGA